MRKSEPGRRIALVTGASRGIGAEAAVQLAALGFHVVVNYREKAKRADAVVEAVRAAGGSASSVRADLVDESAVVEMFAGIEAQFGRLDALVLNASGGLERGADPGYAQRLNCDAQVRLAHLALPLMPVRGRLVFVTSHQAHFHGEKPVPPDYVPIAASKRAGEDALRRMRPLLTERGIKLVVVSGDMIEGTIIVRLLERRNPAAVISRRAAADGLPTINEFAYAVARAVDDPSPSETIYVGGHDYLADCSNPLMSGG
ncbi:short-chain dehydrogenase [Mycobacterium sp. E802]|uniref:SDR family oxidoreductase n=1 Tax=Mycobacterium sp. E802 TaxID=1834152 RepID=UPI000800FBD2|nr:SDR family oxidoreductase [Mycobacterium sp. E802]OBG83435.1 short-chain dehydrogenase [Mycobacterium sp. E802]